MLSSKIFKFTGTINNEKFISDLNKLSDIEEKSLKILLDYQLNEKIKNHKEELIFNFFESKGINLNDETIKSAFSIIIFIENFYNEHYKYIDEIEDVKSDLLLKNVLNEEHVKNVFENLEIIYSRLKDIKVVHNIKKYKEDFLPIIKDISYTTNISMIKNTFHTYSDSSCDFDNEIADLISSTTIKIELFEKKDLFLQLSKENIDNFINILEFAKNDMIKSNELILKLKNSI